MSAIAGVFHLDGSPVERAPLERVMEFLRPQGPDGISYHVAGTAGLGNGLFRATNESQSEVAPCSLDGQVWITADAFLTGREELVDALRAAGREASLNRPDSELILHAYHIWGDACLDRLLGYFAFILWDGTKERVLAARDHAGGRPLYYAHIGSKLVLANSLEGLMRHSDVPARLSEFHVSCFLALCGTTYLDQGGTSYEGVRRVRSSECVIAERGSVKLRRYYTFSEVVEPFRFRRGEEVVERFRQLFTRTIRDRLRSKRLCFTVSGGMDSTSVLAMTAHIIRQRGHGPELVAFSQDHRQINPTREAELAGLLCRQYDIPHVLMNMDVVPWLVPNYVPATLASYPLAHQQHEFAKLAGELAPVIMTGASGDYQRGGFFREAVFAQGLPSALRAYHAVWRQYGIKPDTNLGIYRLRDRLLRRHGHFDRSFPSWLRPDLVARHRLREAYDEHHLPNPEYEALLKLPHGDIRNSCARREASAPLQEISTRVPADWLDPLGDKRILEFYFTLPPLPWFAHKFLLREVMRDLLPDAIRFRRRDQIASHHSAFVLQPGNEWIDEWKPDPRLERFVRRDGIPRLFKSGTPPHLAFTHLRPLLAQLWLRDSTAL